MRNFIILIIFILPLISMAQLYGNCVSGDCENGYGVYVWSSGDKYEGFWKNDKRNGQGTYTHAGGYVRKGKWIDNAYQRPQPYTRSAWNEACNRKSKIDIAD